MASFNDTVELERAFLRAMTSSIIMARTYLHQGSEEWLSSDERRFIFAVATNTLNETNALLTRVVFEYEVASRIDAGIAAKFIGEWNMVEGVESFDNPESIISKLKEAEVGRKALSVTEDVIGMLTRGQITDAVSHLKREAMLIGTAKDSRPLVQLTDIEARLKILRDKLAHPEKYQGIKIGFKRFDQLTGGLFPGELTLLAGVTGLGKSTLCRAISKGIVSGGKNVLHIANEEYLEQVEHKYDALFTGIPYLDFKLARITQEGLDHWQKYMQNEMKATGRGQIFVKEVAAFTDVSLIEQQYRILENRGISISVIIIDHLPHVKPIQQAWGENDERAKAAADCKELARWLKVSVVVPTQAATEVEKKQTQGKRAGRLDVYGSKGQIHVANTFLIITSKGTDDTQVDRADYERDVYWLADVKKNRDGPPFSFFAKHCVRDGNVLEVEDPAKKPGTDKAVKDAVKEEDKMLAAQEASNVQMEATKTNVQMEAIKTMEAIDSGSEDDSEEDSEKDSEKEAAISQETAQAIQEAIGDGPPIPEATGDGPPIVPSSGLTVQQIIRGEKKTLMDKLRERNIGLGSTIGQGIAASGDSK